MRLQELLDAAGFMSIKVQKNPLIHSIETDSRNCTAGSLFISMPGSNLKSESFVASAVQRGAVAVLAYNGEGLKIAQAHGVEGFLLTHDLAAFDDCLWRVCRAYFGDLTSQMKCVGITGTNGKTTVAWILRDALMQLGFRSGYVGTLGFELPDWRRDLPNTTPIAPELYKLIQEAKQANVEALTLEVSSHALALHRADGIGFDVGVFTNLTQDHLDFHESMTNYERAKWRLFSDLPQQSQKRMSAVLNQDDPVGAKWASQVRQDGLKTFQFGVGAKRTQAEFVLIPSEVTIRNFQADVGSIAGGGSFRKFGSIVAPLGGTYNLSNVAAAGATLLALGFDWNDLTCALSNVRPVPGRFEAVPTGAPFDVVVDYAHTPDAIEKLLESVRPLTQGKIITLFGCGGNRDVTKRPLMARAASTRSDLTIITSDNPRFEDPRSIIQDVELGLAPGSSAVSIEDRAEAVAYAISKAEPGDVVVLAGKGHEAYQIVGEQRLDMDDRVLARQAVKS